MRAHPFGDRARPRRTRHRHPRRRALTAGRSFGRSIQPQTDHSGFADFQRTGFRRPRIGFLATPRHSTDVDLAAGKWSVARDRDVFERHHPAFHFDDASISADLRAALHLWNGPHFCGPLRSSSFPTLVSRDAFCERSDMEQQRVSNRISRWSRNQRPACRPRRFSVRLRARRSLCIFVFPVRLADSPRHTDPESGRENPWRSLAAGMRFVFSKKVILATITLDLFAVLLGGATALLPIYADQILHCGPVGLGWMRAAPAVGAFMMALAVAYLPPMKHAGKALLCCVTRFRNCHDSFRRLGNLVAVVRRCCLSLAHLTA